MVRVLIPNIMHSSGRFLILPLLPRQEDSNVKQALNVDRMHFAPESVLDFMPAESGFARWEYRAQENDPVDAAVPSQAVCEQPPVAATH